MSIVSSNEEFKHNILELLAKKGVKKTDFIENLSAIMNIEYKSAENYIYSNSRIDLPKYSTILDIAYAIDMTTYRDNLFYILNLSEEEQTVTHENIEQKAEQTMQAFVPNDVIINGVRFVRADGVDNAPAIQKFLSGISHMPTKPNNVIMRFVCKKETKIVTPYPVQSEDASYKYEYLNNYGRENSQDGYIVVGGNIFHEDTSHAFGYRYEQNQNTISLYSLIENALDESLPSGMVAEYIENFQRVHKRQKFLYGTIGKGGISTNAFCWLNFIVGFYSKLYEQKFS